MSEQIVVGDWVVAGTTEEDLDAGEILELDGNVAKIAWSSGDVCLVDLELEDLEVYGSRGAAEQAYTERKAAAPARYALP